jgi:UDP-N-acetylmuramyl tripeptide synthase
MELWKIHKFCETASLSELRDRRERLKKLIDQLKVIDTNALKALEIMDEYIELKGLFED